MPYPSKPVSIAVVGLACRYPDARSPRELWENILARRRAFRRLPQCRLPHQDYVDPDRRLPDTTYGQRAAVIDGFDFDWAARRIPKTTAQSTDIVHWLALETALACLQDAGLEPAGVPAQTTGVIIGNTLTGEQTRSATLRLRWPYVRRSLRQAAVQARLDQGQLDSLETAMLVRFKAAFPAITEDTLAGGLANTIAGRICHYLDLQGGGYIVDGACSSSLLAVAAGVERLTSGDLDLALIGGVDISLDPFELVGFAKTGALSPGDMNVYDRSGRGFIPGEGCGFVALKRLADARRDKNSVYAVIDGWGISSDGRGAGITAPSVRGQVLALRRALARARVGSAPLDFIEGHGTGTAVGDPIELSAIHNVLSALEGSKPRCCGVTSLKSIIGHTKAASGIGGLIKTVMALNRRVIPPLAGCREPLPLFEKELSTIYPVQHGACRPKNARLRAGVSSMGFGGINCHVVLHSGGRPSPHLAPAVDERVLLASHQSSELFVVAGDSGRQLAARVEDLAAMAEGISVAELTDLASHLADTVSNQTSWRAAVVASDPADLSRSLAELAATIRQGNNRADGHDRPMWLGQKCSPCRVGMLFPGQGAQMINMGRGLIARFDWGAGMLARAERRVGDLEGHSLGHWLMRDLERAADADERKCWEADLARTQIAQPAICLASALWLTFCKNLGIVPVAVAGHSLGELTALFAAGAVDLDALFEFAALRGRVMAQAEHGAMAALGCDPESAGALIAQVDGYAAIANRNAPRQTVVSGETAAVAAILDLARARRIFNRRLPVSGAFHTRMMAAPAAQIQRQARLPATIQKLGCRLFSTLTGRPLHAGEDLVAHLGRQITAPVEFAATVRCLADMVDLMVEVGPGRILTGLAEANLPHRRGDCLPVEAVAEGWDSLNRMLAQAFVKGVEIDWPVLYKNRLVRPFAAPAEKRFIANLCETVIDQDWPADAKTDPQDDRDFRIGVQSVVDGDLVEGMLALVAAMTGFDRRSISLQSRLLDDLNLDSIKAGDLLVKMAQMAGVQWPDDPSVLANARLAEIEAALRQLQSRPAAQEGSAPTGPGASAPSPWVRNFKIGWVQMDLPSGDAAAFWPNTSVLVLHEPSSAAVAMALAETLGQYGARVLCETYQWALEASPDVLDGYSHRIAIMPVEKCDETAFCDHLPRMVAQRAVMARNVSMSTRCLTFVQFGGGRFGRAPGAATPTSVACAALAAGLHHEHPHLRVWVVDLPVAWSPLQIARVLSSEIHATAGYLAVGYDRQGHRWRWQPEISLPCGYPPREIQYNRGDVIVVSGGAKGITLECALAAARETGAQLALLGSSAMQNGNEIAVNLERLSQAGIRARYYRCDITRARAVDEVLATVRREQGPVRALIHGAGLNHPRPAKTVSPEEALAEIGPKVIGFLNLWSVLKQTPPDLVIGLSSIIGLTGMPGNAWYGFANEVLEVILQSIAERYPQTRTQTVAFSIWGDKGMGVRLGSVTRLARMGIEAIDSTEGSRRFARLFSHDPQTSTVVVTSRLGGLDTWRPPGPTLPPPMEPGRYCRQAVMVTPGVEAVFNVHLDLGHDLYLKDHCFQGSYLFPTVFGLEAMTQAALTAAGVVAFDAIRLEGIELKRPITVDPEQGADLVVWAQVVEPERSGAPLMIHTGIRKAESASGDDHFSATLILNPPDQETARSTIRLPTALPLEPRDDLYRETLLFQGGRFQRIERVYTLEGNGRDRGRALLTARKYAAGQAAEMAFAPRVRSALVLPDPFFSDALLQSAALLVPQDVSLPVAIDRIDIFPEAIKACGEQYVEVQLEECTESVFHTHVTALDPGGRPLMHLSGYRLKILKHVEAYPTLAELITPRSRDRRIVTASLRQSAERFKVALPVMDLEYIPGIHALTQGRRRKAELPLLRGLIAMAADDLDITDKACRVIWTQSGKPVIQGGVPGRCELSLAHDDRLCLAVMGSGLQGCDVAPITHRDHQDWRDLLGRAAGELLDSLVQGGDSLDEAGTRIWSAREAAIKALGTDTRIRLEILERTDTAVLMNAVGDNLQNIPVLTQRFRLTWGLPRILAMAVKPSAVCAEMVTGSTCPPAFDGLCRQPAYEILPAGPHGELIFVQRFPVTFKPSAQLSRHVYFTHFFDWMGHAREASTWPIMQDLINLLGTGQWGSVTNFSRLRIFGEVRSGDRVQLRMWTAHNGGPQNSTMTLQYEFMQLLPGGERRLLALSELQTTWVALIGPGLAKPAPYPGVLKAFFDDMIPRQQPLQPDPGLPGRFAQWHEPRDTPIFQAAGGPVIHPRLAVDTFKTALGQANAVGNVYYANYYEWQGALRDHYLQHLLPGYFEGVGRAGEAVCLDCRVDHLREAMPFDRIMVTMALKTLHASRAVLHFDYYRVDGVAAPVKLAWGSHQMVWVERDDQGFPREAAWPEPLRHAWEAAIARDPEVSAVEEAPAVSAKASVEMMAG